MLTKPFSLPVPGHSDTWASQRPLCKFNTIEAGQEGDIWGAAGSRRGQCCSWVSLGLELAASQGAGSIPALQLMQHAQESLTGREGLISSSGSFQNDGESRWENAWLSFKKMPDMFYIYRHRACALCWNHIPARSACTGQELLRVRADGASSAPPGASAAQTDG